MLPVGCGVASSLAKGPSVSVSYITHQSQMASILIHDDGSGSVTQSTWIGNSWIHQGIYDQFVTALCFFNVGVPQGATVKKAYIETRMDAYGGTMNASAAGYWKGWKVDNVTTPIPDLSVTGTNTFYTRTNGLTPTTTAISLATVPAKDARNVTLRQDVTYIVQEIVNRSGWVSGNGLQINFFGSSAAPVDNTYAEAFINRTNNVEPKLVVEYGA